MTTDTDTAPEGQQPGGDRDDAGAQAALAAAAHAENRDQTGGTQSDDNDGGDEQLDPRVRAKLDKANREARALRARLKELEPAATRLRELEDAQKTEAQRLSDQLAEREVELQTLRVERLRNDAGRKAGLDPELWEFITASDEKEALDQARRLTQRLTPPEPGAANLRQGARPTARTPLSGNDALRAMLGHTQ